MGPNAAFISSFGHFGRPAAFFLTIFLNIIVFLIDLTTSNRAYIREECFANPNGVSLSEAKWRKELEFQGQSTVFFPPSVGKVYCAKPISGLRNNLAPKVYWKSQWFWSRSRLKVIKIGRNGCLAGLSALILLPGYNLKVWEHSQQFAWSPCACGPL